MGFNGRDGPRQSFSPSFPILLQDYLKAAKLRGTISGICHSDSFGDMAGFPVR